MCTEAKIISRVKETGMKISFLNYKSHNMLVNVIFFFFKQKLKFNSRSIENTALCFVALVIGLFLQHIKTCSLVTWKQ